MSGKTLQIIDVIKQLPLSEKMHIIELIFKDLRQETLKLEKEESKRRKTAQLLLADYQNDKELTAFTTLDKEDIYEPK